MGPRVGMDCSGTGLPHSSAHVCSVVMATFAEVMVEAVFSRSAVSEMSSLETYWEKYWSMTRVGEGRYTFLWKWIFNAGNDPYTSCWEADVVATKAERNAIYTSMGLSTIDFWYAGGTTPVVPPVIPVVDGLGGTDNTGTGTTDNTGTGTTDNTGTGTIDNTGTGTIDNTGTGTIDNTGTGTIDNTGTGTGTTGGTITPLSFAFNVNAWPGGGQGSLVLPSPRPSGDWYVELKFPCAGSGIILDTWHGDQIQTPEEEAQGIFKIKQTGWQLDKNDIGFVVNTMAGCFVDENQVTAQIVSN